MDVSNFHSVPIRIQTTHFITLHHTKKVKKKIESYLPYAYPLLFTPEPDNKCLARMWPL